MSGEGLTLQRGGRDRHRLPRGRPVPEDRARFDAHVAGCDGCTAYLEQMRETIRLTGMLTEEQVPSRQLERLRQAFRDWKVG